ncbi:SsgA family sporulation/cell division regulator [Streptomyces sp. Y7]|uniref:SsgA family sporulation/cell division regulator n=1 Tax=Streptomyces sp. Y7 TaxID=3342392 RepID=UPI0037216657
MKLSNEQPSLLPAVDDDFEALLDRSSLGAPHVRAAQNSVDEELRQHLRAAETAHRAPARPIQPTSTTPAPPTDMAHLYTAYDQDRTTGRTPLIMVVDDLSSSSAGEVHARGTADLYAHTTARPTAVALRELLTGGPHDRRFLFSTTRGHDNLIVLVGHCTSGKSAIANALLRQEPRNPMSIFALSGQAEQSPASDCIPRGIASIRNAYLHHGTGTRGQTWPGALAERYEAFLDALRWAAVIPNLALHENRAGAVHEDRLWKWSTPTALQQELLPAPHSQVHELLVGHRAAGDARCWAPQHRPVIASSGHLLPWYLAEECVSGIHAGLLGVEHSMSADTSNGATNGFWTPGLWALPRSLAAATGTRTCLFWPWPNRHLAVRSIRLKLAMAGVLLWSDLDISGQRAPATLWPAASGLHGERLLPGRVPLWAQRWTMAGAAGAPTGKSGSNNPCYFPSRAPWIKPPASGGSPPELWHPRLEADASSPRVPGLGEELTSAQLPILGQGMALVQDVVADLSALLHFGDHRAAAVQLHLTYRVGDPYAVEAVFHVPNGPDVAWNLARELLMLGLDQRAGLGDVVAWSQDPGTPPEQRHTFLKLQPSRGAALLAVPREKLRCFLTRTEQTVARGAEERFTAWDTLQQHLHGVDRPPDDR